MRARDLMSTPVISVSPDFPVSEAAALLAQRGFTALPVVDDDSRLIGIVTEADLIRERISPDPRIHGFVPPSAGRRGGLVVADVMTTSVESLTPGADAADIAQMMVAERIRCFPIVDGERLVGVVTRRDLLRAAVSHSDLDLQRDVVGRLAALGDPERWHVVVQAGVADITDRQDSEPDRDQARILAESVPGIVDADVRRQRIAPS